MIVVVVVKCVLLFLPPSLPPLDQTGGVRSFIRVRIPDNLFSSLNLNNLCLSFVDSPDPNLPQKSFDLTYSLLSVDMH